jgi:hypothetical protein
MSQYNWSWWFVLNIIGIVIGMFIAMVAKQPNEMLWSNIILGVTMVSLIPCLYIGMKPSK